MWKYNQLTDSGDTANNNNPLDRGAKIALWGSAISALGDAIATIGGAIAIEEARISDAQQQQALDNLQRQIDELKKEQSQKPPNSPDMGKVEELLQKLIERLDEDQGKMQKCASQLKKKNAE